MYLLGKHPHPTPLPQPQPLPACPLSPATPWDTIMYIVRCPIKLLPYKGDMTGGALDQEAALALMVRLVLAPIYRFDDRNDIRYGWSGLTALTDWKVAGRHSQPVRQQDGIQRLVSGPNRFRFYF